MATTIKAMAIDDINLGDNDDDNWHNSGSSC
jgi:hypothetical protein